jgi:hypothetical protein
MPTKKPKRQELSDEQKKENKKMSSSKVIVEHAIGGVKRCRIVKDGFRCHKMHFEDTVMLIACGLHNFTITMSAKAIEI